MSGPEIGVYFYKFLVPINCTTFKTHFYEWQTGNKPEMDVWVCVGCYILIQ